MYLKMASLPRFSQYYKKWVIDSLKTKRLYYLQSWLSLLYLIGSTTLSSPVVDRTGDYGGLDASLWIISLCNLTLLYPRLIPFTLSHWINAWLLTGLCECEGLQLLIALFLLAVSLIILLQGFYCNIHHQVAKTSVDPRTSSAPDYKRKITHTAGHCSQWLWIRRKDPN